MENKTIELKTLTAEVPASRMGWLTEKVNHLNKRARRLHLPQVLVVKEGEPFEKETTILFERGESRVVMAMYQKIMVTGPEVKLAGWSFLAALDHLQDEKGETITIIRKMPSAPEGLNLEAYRTAKADCNHCGHDRRRNSTFIIRNEAGVTKQVGSTCIKDFTGLDRDPVTMLQLAADWVLLVTEAGDESEGFGGGERGDNCLSLKTYLPWVAKCIREGGWLARKYADGLGKRATADIASQEMFDKHNPRLPQKERDRITTPEPRDVVAAYRAIVWGKKLTPKPEQDYLFNLKALATAGYMTGKHFGLAASMVSSYQRSRDQLKRRLSLRAGMNKDATSGTPKVRQDFRVRCLSNPRGFEGAYGTTFKCEWMDLDTGALLIWWASENAYRSIDQAFTYRVKGEQDETVATNHPFRPGYETVIKATVKGHGSYQGWMQTTLNRVAVVSQPVKAEEVASEV